jgi:hypothetical protein
MRILASGRRGAVAIGNTGELWQWYGLRKPLVNVSHGGCGISQAAYTTVADVHPNGAFNINEHWEILNIVGLWLLAFIRRRTMRHLTQRNADCRAQ